MNLKLNFWAIILLLSNVCSPLFAIDPRYHTYAEMLEAVDSIIVLYPEITKVETLGLSTRDSLTIIGIKVSDNPDVKEDEPSILFNGIHHAEELLGCEVCLYLLKDMVSKYENDSAITYWIDNAEIWIIPILNPEGHNVVTSGQDTIWRKNKRDNNNNGFFDLDSDGVDLNRNYDFNWELGGSPDPASEYYRGPYPFSENETRIIRDLTLQNHFVFDVCYHCVRTGEGELVYYPWRWGNQFAIDDPFIKPIADTIASRIINDAGNGTYTSIYGYATEGTARNYLYGICGTFAYTIEVSRSCYPPGYLVDSICIRNLSGAYYLLERTFGSQITGVITDSITNQPLSAEVRIVNYYDPSLPPRLSDSISGRYRRILNPGTYSIQVIKENYETAYFDGIIVEPGVPTILNIKLVPLGISESILRPEKYALRLSVYPNTFCGKTRISYFLDHNEPDMALKVYNVTGKVVRSLLRPAINELRPTEILWEGTDDFGRKLPAGVYFIRLENRSYNKMEKVILIK